MKIPATLQEKVLELSAKGDSSYNISKWFAEVHNLSINARTIQRFVRREKTVIAQMNQDIYALEVAKMAVDDLDIVDDMVDTLEDMYCKNANTKPEIAIRAGKLLKDYLAFRYELMNPIDSKVVEADKEQILNKLIDKLATPSKSAN
jgi:hypothetical protein